MCTLIALHRIVPGAPLVAAANRDEFFDRPAEGPALRETPQGVIAAPLDVEAGGTWLGMSPGGLFSAVTNVSGSDRDPARRSRGLLVVEMLAARSAREAVEKAVSLPIGAYNPFNLFVADRDGAFAITYEDAPRRVDFGPGVVVIGNAPLDAAEPPKVARVRERVERAAAGSADAVLDALAAVCCTHQGGPGVLDDVCVHTESYGTRSSALLRLGGGGWEDPASVFRFAEGAPCENGYEDHTPLLRELGRCARVADGAKTARTVS